MARTQSRPPTSVSLSLQPLSDTCPLCAAPAWAAYRKQRTVLTLQGSLRLVLQVRHCTNRACARFQRPYRPEAEGALVLPDAEFGLDVIAFIGWLRYTEHRTVP
jgi:hypothetical protein